MKERYHFIGIGGVGMGALASLMLTKGFRVSGSDIKESLLTAQLREQGAEIMIGHEAKNAEGADFIVYSSAIREDNPERMLAASRSIPVIHRAKLLSELMADKISITVAGAHGKTTTTSMISFLLIKAGLDPTTAVGGIHNVGSYHANCGNGKHFVAELDESDGSFLNFRPHYSIITNIDFEHLDYYHSWDNILVAFRQFIHQTVTGGVVIAYGEDERLQRLLKEEKTKTVTYGFLPEDDVYARNIISDGFNSSFECVCHGKRLGSFTLKIPGRHNVLNALACIALGEELNISPTLTRDCLRNFTGVKRRFQIKFRKNGILVVDDYGHHPTEIKATLDTASRVEQKRVITVFQPHRYTRTKLLMDDFVDSLSRCDYLIVTDIYTASEQSIEGASTERLFEKIKQKGQVPVVYLKKEEIIPHLLGIVRGGDLVLMLGAGDITRVADQFAEELEKSNVSIKG